MVSARLRIVFIAFALIVATDRIAFCQPTTAPSFSEDFESGHLDKTIWTQQITGDSTLKVQSDRAAHGKYALMVHCPAGSNKSMAFIMAGHLPETLRQHHFGRAYVYLTRQPPTRHTIFISAGTAGFPKYKYEEVAAANGRWQLTYVDQIDGGEDYHSGGAIPDGRWFCLEWEFNDNPNHATIWIDGQKIYETAFTFKTVGNNLVGGFTDLAVGFRLWGAAPDAFDIYYDDIALSSQKIGPITEKH